ncbi:alpha-lytic protease prodomain-containing protein [Microbispora sp. RL4-1S]|uniref:Alpha-lytic protease prodomain-containing protein n=1 Tax=Microbispora oryzae TaxID=2806554 RepID=A0A940WRX3_9ACTN|nr:S1 family peptidase [Microbispora oryzae]MBP2705936.1 alpha-lytic protease prodomain-containing protein [Microbispora oryzae]
MPHILIAALYTLFAALTSLTVAPVAAAAATEPGPARGTTPPLSVPPQAVLDGLRRDLGLTAPQAEERLANESRASAVEERLRGRLGDAFAGAWVLGPTSATLVVATTDAARIPDIEAENAVPKMVSHSLAQLTAAKAALDLAAATAPVSTPIWYVDTRANNVTVLSSRPAEAAAFVAGAGADPTVVRVMPSDERPRPLYDLRGGDPYYVNDSVRCSIGFSVVRGGTSGFVSAGHCGRAGYPTTAFNNQVGQGVFQGSSFPGNDYSWVATNSSWAARPWVNNGNGGSVAVTGSAPAVEGASVCRSGSTSGWHCGTVEQRNTSVTYGEGTVTGLTRTSVCAEPGDSGGPFISGGQAQGVTSGGSGNCASGGITYFQPVDEILSAYGLTLVTSGITSSPAPGPVPTPALSPVASAARRAVLP